MSGEVYAAKSVTSATNVTLTTTAETVIVTSNPVPITYEEGARLIIIAWAQLTVGTGGVSITPRIRRGSTTSDDLIGEANAETAVAAETVPCFIMVSEVVAGKDNVTYSLTLAVASASGNSTALQATILVIEA